MNSKKSIKIEEENYINKCPEFSEIHRYPINNN